MPLIFAHQKAILCQIYGIATNEPHNRRRRGSVAALMRQNPTKPPSPNHSCEEQFSSLISHAEALRCGFTAAARIGWPLTRAISISTAPAVLKFTCAACQSVKGGVRLLFDGLACGLPCECALPLAANNARTHPHGVVLRSCKPRHWRIHHQIIGGV